MKDVVRCIRVVLCTGYFVSFRFDERGFQLVVVLIPTYFFFIGRWVPLLGDSSAHDVTMLHRCTKGRHGSIIYAHIGVLGATRLAPTKSL
jgi:hypothetical protein